ncbi:hypothetical protein Avbf_01341 [Armadillidium vulgare]|nr:hypothetical protein Avbf_01341 [Armadillidium vulgare]
MKYYLSNISWFLTVFIIFISFNEGHSIHCYECDSSLDMTCGETLADGHTHTPNDCSYLQEPSFCVKMTGLYEVLEKMVEQEINLKLALTPFNSASA